MKTGLTTKERIIQAALLLFNRSGLINVRLQHIADEAQMSVGNLAYHYPDKKQLIRKLEQQIADEIDSLLVRWNASLHLIDFDNCLIQLFHLSKRYAFYFLDILEIKRSYPSMHARRLQQIKGTIDRIQSWLHQNTSNDILRIENPAIESGLAESIWFMTSFWPVMNEVLNKDSDQEMAFRAAVWRLIEPHFTERGKMEYEAMIQPRLFYSQET